MKQQARLFEIEGPDAMTYPAIMTVGHLAALRQLYADALGPRALRVENGELRFRDPADQELCCGLRLVSQMEDGVAIDHRAFFIPPPAEAEAR